MTSVHVQVIPYEPKLRLRTAPSAVPNSLFPTLESVSVRADIPKMVISGTQLWHLLFRPSVCIRPQVRGKLPKSKKI